MRELEQQRPATPANLRERRPLRPRNAALLLLIACSDCCISARRVTTVFR
jgi:hypothetical protein